jgi:hypothetical protein
MLLERLTGALAGVQSRAMYVCGGFRISLNPENNRRPALATTAARLGGLAGFGRLFDRRDDS